MTRLSLPPTSEHGQRYAIRVTSFAPTLHELRRRAAGNTWVCFQARSLALAVGRSKRTITRHLRAIERLPEVVRLVRLRHRVTRRLTGYRIEFRRRPNMAGLVPSPWARFTRERRARPQGPPSSVRSWRVLGRRGSSFSPRAASAEALLAEAAASAARW